MLRPLLVILAASLAAAPVSADDKPASLKALFYGDKGHHRPADRAAQLTPIMAGRGIDVTYTEKLSDLNASNLAKYDALIVYANTTRITPEAEKALLDYVAGGGGFVPLHCASYCFLNSPEYIALVGAQFERHGMAEFDTKVVDPDHPITKGLKPFRTRDETYVHTKHNEKDRHVLQVRAEGDRDEPWTWVRTQGKGRVFYTAYGHDARTWGDPGFHDLVERGIRWASGKGEVFDSRPRVASGLKPFQYTESPAGIPNYVQGAAWGTQREPSRRMQLPLDPAESVKHMALPGDLEAKLFVAEPEIAKPITLAWDHRGRLWIVETTDYPNNLQPPGQGHDRIKICEDTDGDGKADKFTVFAEGLSIPTSITFANGGLIAHEIPNTIFLKDTDGDDKADVKKILFTGWGTDDTHAGPSNLRYALDNWIYGIVGYSGFRGTVGGESFRFAQGFYRFKPDGSKLEFLRNTDNNSWGVGFSEEGLVFGSTANGCPSVFLPIPNRYYESVRGWSSRVLHNIADSYRFFPVTESVRQVDWFGGFTAGAGHALYTARTYPKQYWNGTAFVSEPTGHLVATFTLHPDGADFVSHNAWNLVASDDEWTSPILADVGPDGQVWVIDWYNYIVQHNPTPRGFKTGKGNAYETPLRDKTHGRIYRLVSKSGKASPFVRLDPSDASSLVAGLKSDNMLWRLHAQRVLIERGNKDVTPELVRLVKDNSVDAIGLNTAAIHALWALQGLGAIDGDARAAVVAALRHASAGVRRNAVEVLPRDVKSGSDVVEANLLSDPDAQVRLAALLALSERPASVELGKAVAHATVSGLLEVDGSPSLLDGGVVAAAAHADGFLKALLSERAERPLSGPVLNVVERVAEHWARGTPGADGVSALLVAMSEGQPKVSDAIVSGLSRGWPQNHPVKLDEAREKTVLRLMSALSPAARGRLVSLAGRWGTQGLSKYAAEIASGFLATTKDEAKSERERIAAARQLIELRNADPEAPRELLELISPRTSPNLATGFVEAIGSSEAAGTGQTLTSRLDGLTPAVRPAALRVLLSRADWTTALMDGIDQGKIQLAELTLDQKQALTSHPNRRIAGRARNLLAKGGGLPDRDRQKVIDTLAPTVLNGGDASKGKLVFKDQCLKCHILNGEGGKVGPDLTGMAAHPREELLIHILDPSRSVEGNFVQYSVATNDGRVLNGLMASESKSAIELLDAEGKTHTIQREDIEEMSASRKSLMPEGFEKQVSPSGIADLLAFLTARGKYLPLDLRKAATVTSTRGMFFSEDAEMERLIFPDWNPKTVEGVPFLLVDPQGDRVRNAILLYGPQGSIPPRMPRSVELPCHAPASAIHLLSGVSGWGFPYGEKDTVSMIVRLRYADGQTEDHPLRNGVEFADYIRPVEVPGSKLAFKLGGRQIRFLSVRPKRKDKIESIELVKGPDESAPVVMAVTVEAPDNQ
jgi:putative membrane-bound dehydrogenase-like protein